MTDDQGTNEDLKAKMREALDRKRANDRGVPGDGPVRQKAHGSEVEGGGGRRMHRRKAGGS
ncbi:MAG: DUF5302 domain-containing protein [Nocardioidaceae bacterium]